MAKRDLNVVSAYKGVTFNVFVYLKDFGQGENVQLLAYFSGVNTDNESALQDSHDHPGLDRKHSSQVCTTLSLCLFTSLYS